ncbi:MAG: HAMP domain-containing protein [Rhodospirillaceae bacterium]|jgi:methyl-accepting chemotaxis protein|nr:HAMP domain-containing protein [Rhodospirillales bacterium]MBT3906440.1 HAMP domain-containing protein [Rhodospirillaceae bacterium]MBT4702752.1 HAMP domain-containing protein [Rhodospirillaceae bacterium]MBT5034604.1 HAMP domain-containing protein [Rhodospirillaceae bacterium]MBT6364175.1 HAMP domain-containing protein [Rhodospirillaceae bacterium]
MTFPAFKIATKLPLIIISAALVASLITGINSYRTTSGLLTKAANEKLTALMVSRKAALSQYLSSIREDLLVTASNGAVISAMNAFQRDFAAISKSGDPDVQLQKIYIQNNPNKLGEKHKLIMASDGSAYSKTHGQLHPWFKKFLEARGYYDVFLVDPKGNVVYSVFKELDFATNLDNGQWKYSDLGNAFRKTKTAAKDSVMFFDFKPYAPSANAPASFIATPIIDAAGKNIGSLVFQMPVDRINTIMQVAAGMGESGETYIVGKDFLMRSNSRFSKEPTILKTKVETATVKKALANKSGIEVTPDYRGIPVFSAYTPIVFEKTTFAILAEIDESEVLGPVRSMAQSLLIAGVILAIIVSVLGIFFARRISRPIDSMTQAMGDLAGGNLKTEIPALELQDEIGAMAKAVEVFKANMIEAERLGTEQRKEAGAKEARLRAREKLMVAFEQGVSGVLSEVATASNSMQAEAEGMVQTADDTMVQSNAVASAAEQTSANVQTAATAAEELSASIGEISRQVTHSSQIANDAVNEVRITTDKIQDLSEASQKIGAVVALITDIADQTNLLALNATIEAARAGDAGKGFAVVASEVKNLANQTAKATEDISVHITGIQQSTGEAVKAIDGIGSTITNISEAAGTIAAAVEEQGAATQEIARSVEQAASGTTEVTSNILTVNTAASDTGSAANSVLNSVGTLSDHSDNLRGQVEKFLIDIKAA